MTKKIKKLNLVIEYLSREIDKLEQDINFEKGSDQNKIELKEQMKDAVSNLELCSLHNIFAKEIEVIEIEEGGSDAYFTEFNIIDEAAIENIPEWAIKKDNNEELKLSCFDLIIKR